MQNVNIERGLALMESRLKDRKCLPLLLSLANEHPESINKYISLAESIEVDLKTQRLHQKLLLICSNDCEDEFVDSAFFIIPNLSIHIPKGRYTVAFCDDCFYLDSQTKQVKINYSNIKSIINVGTLDQKNVVNVVVALKTPLEMGKRKMNSLCILLDNIKDRKMMFEDQKRQVSGKLYSIFLTVLKLKCPYTLIKPETSFFISSQRTSFIKCYHGTSPCFVIPCRPCIIILSSLSVVYIKNEDITALNLDRLGGSTFDFVVKTGKMTIDLTMVSREERSCLEEYSKEIIKENKAKQNGGAELSEDHSSEEEFSEVSEDEDQKQEDTKALRDLVKDHSGDELSDESESRISGRKRARGQ